MNEVNDVTRDLEQFWIKIEVPGRKYLILGVMYRAPAGSIKNFMNELKCSIDTVREGKGGHEHIIMGDFNIDFGHKESPHSKNMRDLMGDAGMVHLETSATRITSRGMSTLDLIFTDMDYIMEYGVKNVAISDHLPTYVIKKKGRQVKKNEIVKCRNTKNYSFEALEKLIRQDVRWHEFWRHDISVDELWDTMYCIFLDVLDVLCPFVNRYVETNAPGWVTKEVRMAIKEKNSLYNAARRSGAKEDWVLFRQKKKSMSKLIVDTKCKVMKNKLDENKGNPKKFWRQINSEILGKGDKGGMTVLKDHKGLHMTGVPAAEFANKYFAEMGKSDTSNPTSWTEAAMNMDHKDNDMSFMFVELLEVHQLIQGIDIYKASGIEGITSKLLKDCLLICEFELSYLFNMSLYNMKFPSAWKSSIITPIHKAGDKLKADNWRPIDNLCVPGKLLEKCVYRQIEEYMEHNNLICKSQHGFRKGRGTDTAVMDLVRKLFSNINDNSTSSVLFLDYSRAFNTVDHDILLRKLNMYGLSINVCKWFEDYFANRTQFTRIGSVLSSGVSITHGVYQGSPLGPLLFIIYINDLVSIMDSKFCNMYADDTVIVSTNVCASEVVRGSCVLFKRISEWC